jgi:exodeoxyribonuclease III
VPVRRARHALKIATWNVNSIRAREARVAAWLERVEPDVLCLQETKVVDEDFPTEAFQRLGYSVAMAGQKSYNGVAIASRLPMSDVRVGLPGDGATAEKRLIGATVAGVRVLSAYVPNGKSVALPSFRQKLDWLARLEELIGAEARSELALAGDFNVARETRDVYDPAALEGQLHFHPEERRAMQALLDTGLSDAFRLHHAEAGRFSWWDYRGGGFRRNLGLRIDYILLSRPLADRCSAAYMDVEERRGERPSDHVPVVAEIE